MTSYLFPNNTIKYIPAIPSVAANYDNRPENNRQKPVQQFGQVKMSGWKFISVVSLCLILSAQFCGSDNVDCYRRMMRSSGKCGADMYDRILVISTSSVDYRIQVCNVVDVYLRCLEYIKRELTNCPESMIDMLEDNNWQHRKNVRYELGCGSSQIALSFVLSMLLTVFAAVLR